MINFFFHFHNIIYLLIFKSKKKINIFLYIQKKIIVKYQLIIFKIFIKRLIIKFNINH